MAVIRSLSRLAVTATALATSAAIAATTGASGTAPAASGAGAASAAVKAASSPSPRAASSPASAPRRAEPAKPRTSADIVREAPASAWRTVDASQVLRMTLPSGVVWIELAPRFAPKHARNIGTLVDQHYFDGLAILRVQDNFVTQWGDPDADTPQARPLGAAQAKLAPEFTVPYRGLKVARLPDRDVWAPVTGFVDGFPVAAEPARDQAWIAHCYGVVGAGRGDTVDSGSGAELYVVIGQSPRGLDRNITPVGRVLQGMEHLSALPRGGPNMGFYDQPSQYVRIARVQRLADLPPAERPEVKVFRTDSRPWAELVDSRRNRRDDWYVHRAGAIDLCNLSVPVRITAPGAAAAEAAASASAASGAAPAAASAPASAASR